jgi:hypothetical protein
MLDVGAVNTSGHRLKVINGGDGIQGSLQYLSGTTSRFYIDSSSGNVGIGTTPAAKLHATGTFGTTLTSGIRLDGLGVTTNNLAPIAFYTQSSSWGTQHAANIAAAQADGADGGAYLRFSTSPDGNTAPAERLRIDASGNVGIGNTVASSMNAGANQLVVGSGSTGQGITLYSSTSTAGSIHFADGTSGDEAYRGQLVYNHSGDYMAILTAATERMRLTSSGNLLVGKTSTAFGTEGFVYEAGAAVEVTTDSNRVMRLNRTTNDGNILELNKDGTAVGSIGVNAGSIAFGQSNTAIGAFNTDRILFPATASGVVQDNAIDLGYSNGRFKDLYLSGGVYLGGTGAANHLDDYEEGTWTPIWTPASGSGQTISTASGWYTKTGNRVFVDIHLATNGHGTASGDLTLGGLPFTQTTNSGQNASLSCGQAANAGLVAGQAGAARVNQSATTITPLVWSATTGTTTMTAAQWGVSGTWRFTGSYQV